jgi:hypothetical protein
VGASTQRIRGAASAKAREGKHENENGRSGDDMRTLFPPRNGPLASDLDDPKATGHSIGRHVIYSAFAWSVAESAHKWMRQLAVKHRVGFYDVSVDEGEVLFPS